MPSISRLSCHSWKDYNIISQDTILFSLTVLCPKCGAEWSFSPTKTVLSDAKWSLISYMKDETLIWVEGLAKMFCLKCDGVATFHFGVHHKGSTTVGPYNEAFDTEWWIDPDERKNP